LNETSILGGTESIDRFERVNKSDRSSIEGKSNHKLRTGASFDDGTSIKTGTKRGLKMLQQDYRETKL
jgi:hypothetical protein